MIWQFSQTGRLVGTEPAQSREGHACVSRIGSAPGGGWTSHNPTPGGAMEGGSRC
jgi:hypothetical protein